MKPGDGEESTLSSIDFQQVYKQCQDDVGFVVSRTIQAQADSIIVKNANRTPDLNIVSCMLGRLGASEVLVAKIASTRAIDGMQSYEDAKNGFAYSWSFTPQAGLVPGEDGLTLIVERMPQ